MRALLFDGILRVEHNAPMPEPLADQALLKIRRAGICNTDLEIVRGYANYTGILGHEFVAEVAAGPEALVGRRVVGEINVSDGTCDMCRRGIPSQCRQRRAVGIHGYPGAFAEYLALPVRNLHLVPDNVSDDQAVFVEPLAAALNILEMLAISPRERVLVLGVGKLGFLAAQVLRLSGADVVGVVRRDTQARLLAQWGISARYIEELPKQQAQVVVDCTGLAEGFADALTLVEPRGTIVLKSTYQGLPQVDLSRVAVNEIRVIGSRCGPFPAALRLLAGGLVDVETLIERRYGLDDALQAIEYAGQKGVLKVLLEI
ncbi:MAG: alcohol dehydrogenase catalytic domain-containing protein [Chloroflexi bacterium]|nr:alcohol dehydrogenase catalytic domain-containing protein [Chloroflexota bacterium]